MDTDNSPLPARRARHQEVIFDGDTLLAVVLEDGVAVPVRNICEAIGLDLEAQNQNLRTHPVLSEGLRIVNVPVGGRVRSVSAIVHRWIPFWLATIRPDQVKAEVRPKLVRYQTEVAFVLGALYGNELNPAPVGDPASVALQQQLQAVLREARLIRETFLANQQELQQLRAAQAETDNRISKHAEQLQVHDDLLTDLTDQLNHVLTISAAQQQVIKQAILRIAARYKKRHQRDIFARLFSEFCNDLNTPRYSALPAGKYDAALAWLRQKAEAYLPGDDEALPPLQEVLR